jgi:2-hydroxy-3-oxopropionate reductase
MSDSLSVACIGLGVMGAGIASNIVRGGFPTRVYNRSPKKAVPLAALGAVVASSVGEAVSGADVVVLSLPATRDVEALLFGDLGIAAAMAPGAVVIDTSTIDAVAARDLAGRLASSGKHMLDAPVSGGHKGAVEGTLSCMIGGADEAVARARPVIEAFAKTIVHVGASGAGQVTKACNQICVAASMAAVAESVALCRTMEVDAYRVREALLGGAARSTVVEKHMHRLLNGDTKPGFRAVLMEKDIAIALDTLRSLRVASPVTAVLDQLMHSLVVSGRGEEDWCSLGHLIQDWSNTHADRR